MFDVFGFIVCGFDFVLIADCFGISTFFDFPLEFIGLVFGLDRKSVV